MNTSLFELFKIGNDHSSSHTVGSTLHGTAFRASLNQVRQPDAGHERYARPLRGLLALTGDFGHGTDRSILLGLLGESPDTVNLLQIETMLAGYPRHAPPQADGHSRDRLAANPNTSFSSIMQPDVP